MLGLKVLEHDYTALNDFQYELGKEFVLDESLHDLEIGFWGFHFSPKLSLCFQFKMLHPKRRVVLVRTKGKIRSYSAIFGVPNFCTDRIEILEEIPKERYLKLLRNRLEHIIRKDYVYYCWKEQEPELFEKYIKKYIP